MLLWVKRLKIESIEKVCVDFGKWTTHASKIGSGPVSKWVSGSESIIKMHRWEFPTISFIWGTSLKQSQHASVMVDASAPGGNYGWSRDAVTLTDGHPAITAISILLAPLLLSQVLSWLLCKELV